MISSQLQFGYVSLYHCMNSSLYRFKLSNQIHSVLNLQNNVSHEVSTVINMSALAVSQLLENAQDKGVELQLETSALENEALLKEVEQMMKLDALPSKAPQRLGTLKSFKDDAKALREESGRVEDVNRKLQQQIAELNSQVGLLTRQLREERNSVAEGKQSDRHSVADAAEKIRKLERQLQESTEENTKRVSETKQFQEMRKMMQSQSRKMTDLRRRLERYEPDATDMKEDDDP